MHGESHPEVNSGKSVSCFISPPPGLLPFGIEGSKAIDRAEGMSKP